MLVIVTVTSSHLSDDLEHLVELHFDDLCDDSEANVLNELSSEGLFYCSYWWLFVF